MVGNSKCTRESFMRIFLHKGNVYDSVEGMEKKQERKAVYNLLTRIMFYVTNIYTNFLCGECIKYSIYFYFGFLYEWHRSKVKNVSLQELLLSYEVKLTVFGVALPCSCIGGSIKSWLPL